MRPHIDDVAFAVEEHIWGHRLYDEQLPHLTFLEFLGILLFKRDNPLAADQDGLITYTPRRQFVLRNILFNNPHIETVSTKKIPDDEKWMEWQRLFLSDSAGVGDSHLEHLRDVFQTFEDFARSVELLRASAFEANSNKRWSSKFVFPFGPDTLYEDLRVDPKTGNATNDRRFFARTGEMLYLMLCRAANASVLGRLLVKRMFDQPSSLNRLAKAIQGTTDNAKSSRTSGYLPDVPKDRFDRMCDDWIAILSRNMPAGDAIEHLVTSAGLNLLLYFLERGKATVGDSDPVEFISEIVSKDRSKVRALSADSWQSNQGLSLRATRASIEGVRSTQEWEEALASGFPRHACCEVLRARFQWPKEGTATSLDPDELIAELVDEAESRHGQHFGKIHSAWTRALGLSSRRLSRRTRYAPNDRLLKTLVVTMVDGRMEFGEFLREARRRYGLIIGENEGARLVHEGLVDQEALSDNAARLEERLLGLGLLRRLSDSCSFVENPFGREEDR